MDQICGLIHFPTWFSQHIGGLISKYWKSESWYVFYRTTLLQLENAEFLLKGSYENKRNRTCYDLQVIHRMDLDQVKLVNV